MEKIKINFLGTSGAVPTPTRNHTGILVSYKAESILFDCGEGIQRQFKIARISPTKLTRIFITHWHGDHFLGLPGLLQTLAMANYSKKLKIYGPVGTNKFMSLISQIITGIKINLEIIEIHPGKKVEEKEFYIESEAMVHGTPALAYSFVIKDKFRLDKKKIKKLCLPNSSILSKLQAGQDIIHKGKKIKASKVTYLEKGKKLTIILDTGVNVNAEKIAKNADVLISESTFSSAESHKAFENKHLTASQAATIAKKAKVKRLVLVHISDRHEPGFDVIKKEAKKIFNRVVIAKDFDFITF